MKGIQLTTEDKQLLTEALLFSVFTDVCAEWTPKQLAQMIELAKRLNDSSTQLQNIYIFDVDDGVGVSATEALENFPNIPVNKHIR